MARKNSLPPGFRFHPTDVELVMYYLKRKVMGKKLRAEAIAEVNIYKFSPWDLPDMSCLKCKDMEWFFFCPTERKYTRGARIKRATENGYWKTTGKDRPVHYGDKTVGTVKTLVFHLGHAPQGERTDWVIHEYRILDDQLAAAGLQDTYALCKVFKKNGPGPKLGAQYGAPFKEEEWSDDDVNVSENPELQSPTALLLEKQGCVMTGLADPSSTFGGSTIEEGSNQKQKSVVTDSFELGSTSGLYSFIQEGLAPSAGPISNQLLEHGSDDDIVRLLASFTDDTSLLVNRNGNHEDHLNGNRENQSSILGLDGYDIYSELQDLNNSAPIMDEERLDLSVMQNDDYTTLNNILDNSDYIELNDLLPPSNCSPEIGNDLLYDIFGSSSHNNVPQLCFAGMYHHPASGLNQLPALADQSYKEDSGFNMLHEGDQVNNQFYQETNAVYDSFTHAQSSNWENAGLHFDQYMNGGR